MPRKSKSSLSHAQSYREIGDFWDSHDLGDFWEETKDADFEVSVESEATYYCLEKTLSKKVQLLAREQGISANTLINLWVQEKLRQCG